MHCRFHCALFPLALLLAAVVLATPPAAGQTPEPAITTPGETPEGVEPAAAAEEADTVQTPYAKEIHELHDFFQQWFRGELPDTDETFSRFTGVMADTMVHINPGGTASEYGALVAAIRQGHGGWKGRGEGWKIEIRNVQLRQEVGDVSIVTYEEWQFLGEQTRVRLSTVVFGKKAEAPNGLEWLHVHEVWMPRR